MTRGHASPHLSSAIGPGNRQNIRWHFAGSSDPAQNRAGPRAATRFLAGAPLKKKWLQPPTSPRTTKKRAGQVEIRGGRLRARETREPYRALWAPPGRVAGGARHIY